MRCGPFLVMLALLVGAAPALAQDLPGLVPMPKQTDAKPAKKHVRHKAVAAEKSAEAEPCGSQAGRNQARPKQPPRARPKRATAKAAGASPATGKPGMVKNAIEGKKSAAKKSRRPNPNEPMLNQPRPGWQATCSPESCPPSA